jgi:hypothetical protein
VHLQLSKKKQIDNNHPCEGISHEQVEGNWRSNDGNRDAVRSCALPLLSAQVQIEQVADTSNVKSSIQREQVQ